MSSELESLKQRIIELEAKNDKLEAEIAELRKGNTEIHDLRIKLSISDAEIAELKRRNAEFLRANEEYNERRDAENAKLKARIEELESEFGDRITKVEQKQTLNEPRCALHNSSNNSSPSFNSVAVPEAITVPTNSAKRLNGKLLEEKDMDSFLLEAHKKIVSSEIKQRNKERKLHAESVASSEQEAVKQSCQNSHKKKGIDKIKYLSTYSPNSISELTNDQIQEIIEASERRDNSAEQDDFPTPEISAGNLETSEKILPEENSSLSADLEDYIKTLTGDFDDETAYWGTPYENEARVEKEEVNEVKGSPRVQSNDDVYFDEEVDHDSAPHPVEETNDDNDCSHNNDSEEEMPDEELLGESITYLD